MDGINFERSSFTEPKFLDGVISSSDKINPPKNAKYFVLLSEMHPNKIRYVNHDIA